MRKGRAKPYSNPDDWRDNNPPTTIIKKDNAENIHSTPDL